MSEPRAFGPLATLLATVDPAPAPAPVRIYEDPAEAMNLGDVPAIVLSIAPGMEHAWRQEALGQPGLGQHDYTIAIWCILGTRNTDLGELYAAAKYWPRAVAKVLGENLTLDGTVVSLGFRNENRLFTYRIGPIPWGSDLYYGLTMLLPTRENVQQTFK